MKCSQLLEGLVYKCLQGELSSEVTAVVNDSRKLEPGCMFICIKGASFDGHTFAAEAAEKATLEKKKQERMEMRRRALEGAA